ncbi:DUF2207 domain-containing protein [Luteimonas soli]|uniref:DUF2207 domain-containing protein n=1 Tax=Luteimonas soli TaxID=1648966 RepID=A0ABV7XNT8_9GAMM
MIRAMMEAAVASARAIAAAAAPAALVVLALLGAPQAQANERIVSYDSVIEVHADGSLDITEDIRVRAEGSAIRRGIYRDFPTRYRDRFGNRMVVDFEVLDLQRDGQPEPWFTERHGNGVRVNTGNDDFLKVPAEYTYTLRYRTDRQLGFFDDHDELYFNAIGTGWNFPIERGSVEVRLPQAVPATQLDTLSYLGGYGSAERGFEGTVPSPGVARWTLSRPLARGEGTTVVLSFPKGIVDAPTTTQKAWWLLRDNSAALIALCGLVVLLVFCIARWHRVGRDPPPGVVVVRYEPPGDYSPADLRFVRRMAYDDRCFSSDLLASAVDGKVRIHKEGDASAETWRLEYLAAPGASSTPGTTSTPREILELLVKGGRGMESDGIPGPRRLLDALFKDGRELELDNANAATVANARMLHSLQLEKRFKPRMFKRHGGSILVAMLIMAVTLALAIGIGVAWLGSGIVLVLPIALAMLATVITFGIVVKAPTPEGRRLLDATEGFRRYLAVAERDELAGMQGPGEPPMLDAERYERLLPYAVALDVEDAWTKHFTLAVGAAAAAATTAAITWYRGGQVGDLGSMTRAIGNSLSSQIASSASPPGSSSGGGGGGFSGGGGGGGGGGGR